MSADPQTTRAEANALKLLRAKGYCVTLPHKLTASKQRDQCEYPDRQGTPGDTCFREAARNRKTSQGTMWLCADHMSAPESELFDERPMPDPMRAWIARHEAVLQEGE